MSTFYMHGNNIIAVGGTATLIRFSLAEPNLSRFNWISLPRSFCRYRKTLIQAKTLIERYIEAQGYRMIPANEMSYTPPTHLATNANILTEALHMATIPRFLHLLQHAKLLIQTYGPYTTNQKSTVLIRGQNGNQGTQKLSTRLLASSFAAAQDCSDSTQPFLSIEDDLDFFKKLWTATIAVLDAILDAKTLSTKALGWGLLGLCSGYNTLPGDPEFSLHKLRLHNVMGFLPSIGQPSRNWNEYRDQMRRSKKNIQILTNIQPEAHFCTTMLVQRFRADGWARIRWWQAVAVAERWVANLGLGPAVEDGGQDLRECSD